MTLIYRLLIRLALPKMPGLAALPEKVTIMIHPGGFLNNGKPNVAWQERLEGAYWLWVDLLRKGFKTKDIFFVSSVKDQYLGQGKSQAEIMADWLMFLGISQSQIRISNQSHSTWEDIYNSFGLVLETRLPPFIIHVSSTDHINFRIRLMAWFWGRRMQIRSSYVCSGWMFLEDSNLEWKKILKTLWLILKDSV